MYNNKIIDIKDFSTRGLMNAMRKPELKKILWNETSFIQHDANCVERIWYVKNNLFKQARCPVCGKLTKIKNDSIACCSFKCTISKVDPVTGLSKAQITGLKSKESNGKCDSSGLTGYQRSSLKIKETLSKINIDTGLTKAQERGLKTKATMSKINPNTGLTGYQAASQLAASNMKKIDLETGLSINDIRIINAVKNNRGRIYDNILSSTSDEYEFLTTRTEFQNNINEYYLKYKHQCGTTRIKYNQEKIRCLKCYPYNRSIGENEALEYCRSINDNVISGTRQIIKPLELDIYIPDYNLAIEYDGLFWHSSYSLDSENKERHLHKTQECEKKGIQLFHIFENEWLDIDLQNIWKSIISNKLGNSKRIFARKCEIKKVSSTDKTKFLNSNHLQGNCMSSVNLGLYLGDELVSLMTFGKSRYNKKIDWELLRFCNLLDHSVVGGASRLLKSFRSENKGSIISYADKRRSNGNLYNQLGFSMSHDSIPNYFYWEPGTMVLDSRIKYQKHKLKDKLEIFDHNLTESENMYNNGYHKIYDCGNQVWILN